MLKNAFICFALLAPRVLLAEAFQLSKAEEKRVEVLLKTLTLDEKIGQVTQYNGGKDELASKGGIGSVLNRVGAGQVNAMQELAIKSRAGVPIIFGLDVIHGYRTTFPIPLAEACSWDPLLAERTAAAAALEAYADGIRWTFAPMVDIARDPRWGRIMEGAGEDPGLGADFAAARVRGFQKDRRLAACAKHFVGYGAAEAGRDYNSTEIPARSMRETYYPPFQSAVEAGVVTFMSSFNTVNGLPLAADPQGLRQTVKDAWGFQGLVVSDWGSITELIAHGVASDKREAARLGMLSGVDMDMEGENYLKHLAELVKSGDVPEALLDDAVRRILRVKLWLGLFEQPKVDETLAAKVMLSAEHRALAREAASRSSVLLKNDGTLPFSPKMKRLAVIGPLADSQKDPLGNWSAQGKDSEVVSVLAGIKARLGSSVQVEFVQGTDVRGKGKSGFDAAVKAAKAAEAVVLVLGEDRDMSGEAYSRTEIGLPGVQRELAEAVLKAGKPTVLVLMNGRPLTLEWEDASVNAILETWFGGVEAGPAVAGLLFGDESPEGRLAVTFPRNVGQIPLYHSVLPTGRPASKTKWTSKYIDSPNTPLYPFGHGLTYTRFEYSGLKVQASVPAGEDVVVRVKVANVGKRAGVEVAQLYLHDRFAAVSRPSRELKGYARVELQPGESREVTFTLGARELAYFHPDLSFGFEAGDFEVWVGPDAASGLSASFAVTGKAGMHSLAGQRPGLALAAVSRSTRATQARAERPDKAAESVTTNAAAEEPTPEPAATGPKRND